MCPHKLDDLQPTERKTKIVVMDFLPALQCTITGQKAAAQKSYYK